MGLQHTLPSLCVLSFRGEKQGGSGRKTCRQGNPAPSGRGGGREWKAQLCENISLNPTVSSAVSILNGIKHLN